MSRIDLLDQGIQHKSNDQQVKNVSISQTNSQQRITPSNHSSRSVHSSEALLGPDSIDVNSLVAICLICGAIAAALYVAIVKRRNRQQYQPIGSHTGL